MTYQFIALNGSEHTDASDRINLMHREQAEAWLTEHACEVYEKQDRDERKMIYGAEYFVEVGGDFDEDGEFDVAATIEAHDISTDHMDWIEANGIYDVSDVRAYAEIGTKDQKERARDLALWDTRAEARAECRAGRAAQVARRVGTDAPSRGEAIVARKQGKAPKRKSKRLANRIAGAVKRR